MKRIASLLFTATFTFVSPPPAYADVNMMKASFQTSFIDLEINGLKIQRHYDSRSNDTGVFGFGWCSTFDTRLETSRTADGLQNLQINDCGKRKAANVLYKSGTYSQTLPTGLTRVYDADTGDLIRLRAGSRPEVAIERSRNRLPRAAALGEGKEVRQTLTLEFDSLNETVTAIDSTTGQHADFTYSPDRNLLSVKNAWKNTYRFEYDPLHNLTSIAYPDSTTEQMSYDSDHDRILSFQGRDGCTEVYSHQLTSSLSQKHQTSTARLTCLSKLKREVRFDFGFIQNKGRWSLSEMSLTRDGVTQKTSFSRGAK